jgi:hypothetical protein
VCQDVLWPGRARADAPPGAQHRGGRPEDARPDQFTCRASSRRRSPSAMCGEYLYGGPRRQPADSANDVGLQTAIRGPITAALTRPRRRVHFDRAGRVVDVTSPVMMPGDAADPTARAPTGALEVLALAGHLIGSLSADDWLRRPQGGIREEGWGPCRISRSTTARGVLSCAPFLNH